MTSLSVVRSALEGNADIVIIDIAERNYLPETASWCHTVDFFIAPKVGVYDAERLQDLMLSLVPGLTPTTKDDFCNFKDTLHFGKLYFDEVIGQEYREMTISDEDLKNTNGLVGGHLIFDKKDLKRRVWVRLYPDVEIATRAAKGSGDVEYSIPKVEMPVQVK